MEGPLQKAPVGLYSRTTLDLSGEWQYIVDPMQEGLHLPRKGIRHFADDARPKGNRLIEYDFNYANNIQVPSDWNTQVEKLFWYEGLVWYRRTFEYEPNNQKKQILYFEGANYWKRVYLNRTALGEHEGGFTPFSFDVTDKLKSGRNSIVVAVDNTRRSHQIPALKFDWFNYGGITRPVHVFEVPKTYVSDYELSLQKNGKILATIQLAGDKPKNQSVDITISELNIQTSLVTNDEGKASIELTPQDLQYWSPQSPKLYNVTIAKNNEQITERIGFRYIETRGPDILLNGEPVFLAGISVHEEAIGAIGGRAMTWAEARALLMEVKALGANYVRLAHYPHSEMMTRLADEIGLLVWSEVPLWQSLDFDDPRTLQTARNMILESIDRDFNRASVIIWSVANETPQTESRLSFLRNLIDLTRARDPSRLVSSALDKNKKVGNTIHVEDPLGEFLDVYAVNTYEGWYGPRTPSQIAEVNWSSRYNKPMIFSEFGAGALKGHFGDADQRWTEDCQRAIYQQTLMLVDRTPTTRGISPWILKDFRSPRRYHGLYQDYWNRKGIINEYGQPKLAYEVLKKWITNKVESQQSKAK